MDHNQNVGSIVFNEKAAEDVFPSPRPDMGAIVSGQIAHTNYNKEREQNFRLECLKLIINRDWSLWSEKNQACAHVTIEKVMEFSKIASDFVIGESK